MCVCVFVVHGQGVHTNVYFAPSLSFLCIYCVLLLGLISLSVTLPGVYLCVCLHGSVFVRIIEGIVCVFSIL